MGEDALRRVRGICLALPEAFEQEAWGHPTFRVRRKMFAAYSDGTSSGSPARPTLACNAPLGVQAHLVRAEPAKYYVPPYVGVRGWIGVYPDACTDEEIRAHVQQSYCMVAPRRLQALVPE